MRSAALLSVSALFSVRGRKNPWLRGRQVPPEPARSVSTLSAGLCTSAVRPTVPGLFRPGDAHEHSPSGSCSSRRSGGVVRHLASRAVSRRLCRRARLRRVDPSGCRERVAPKSATPQTLLAFSPLRLSLPPPWIRLPGASSHVLRPAPLPDRSPVVEHVAHLRVLPSGGLGCRSTTASEEAAAHRTGPSGVRHLFAFPLPKEQGACR